MGDELVMKNGDPMYHGNPKPSFLEVITDIWGV